jgi:hypothetical protein
VSEGDRKAENPKARKKVKPSWEYIEVPDDDPVDKYDDSYRNGPKGTTSGVTVVNVVSGKRERKNRDLSLPSPSPQKKTGGKKGKKKLPPPPPPQTKKKQKKKADAADGSSEERPRELSFLDLGTSSRGPITNRGKPKSLAELYPWKALAPEWMDKATSRLEQSMSETLSRQCSEVADYSGNFPCLMKTAQHDLLKSMWNVCNCVPGEGSSAEPLYGEINLTGVARLFAIWKETCQFSESSQFLDVGSGLGKMVFHAAVDPGVELSHGIELSQYRAESASGILRQLLPKVGLHLQDRVSLRHEDVKTTSSWQGLTHIYMFDLGFPADQSKGPYPHILKLWLESTTAKYLISYRRPHFLWQRGFNLKLVNRLRVKQQGSKAGSHLAYFYEKIIE